MFDALKSISDQFSFRKEDLDVAPESVLKGLGMELKDADDYLLELIRQYTHIAKKLAQPRASFSFFDAPLFDLNFYRIQIRDTSFSTARIVTQLLKKSEYIVVFAVTIGSQLEEYSKQEMQKGNSLEGYILDILGSELAEEATEFLHEYLRSNLRSEGLSVSNRYSPGYCNWPVDDQQKLFKLLSDSAGITLNDSSLMQPTKSVSGFLGIGKNIKSVEYKCRICDDSKCILRKHK